MEEELPFYPQQTAVSDAEVYCQ